MAKTPTDIKSLARRHTELALKTLVGIAGQAKAPSAARVAAASALLDRGWGKPKQELEHTGDALGELMLAITGAARARPAEDDDQLTIQ